MPEPASNPGAPPNSVLGGLCARCGYNLRGLPPSGACPECGLAITSSVVAVNTTSTLDTDRPCLTCGYNLRGLSPSVLCPECGTPVERSLRGNLLLYSSPEYLATLHRGVFLIQFGVIGLFLTYLGFPLIGVAAATAGPTGSSGFRVYGPGVVTLLLTLMGFVSLTGWWLFSSRDPAQGERDEGATARVVLRVTLIIQLASSIVSIAMNGGGAWRPGTSPGVVDILGGLIFIASFIATIVWFFAAMRYIRMLAPRLPSERILRRSKLLTWLVPVLLIVVCVGWLVDLILYYNLLERVRKDLKGIRAEQAVGTHS